MEDGTIQVKNDSFDYYDWRNIGGISLVLFSNGNRLLSLEPTILAYHRDVLWNDNESHAIYLITMNTWRNGTSMFKNKWRFLIDFIRLPIVTGSLELIWIGLALKFLHLFILQSKVTFIAINILSYSIL